MHQADAARATASIARCISRSWSPSSSASRSGTSRRTLGAQMKPLGDGFIKLIKMMIAPIIFCTVVTGIAGMENMKAVGKTGVLALLYFEIVSTHRADRRPRGRQRGEARRRHERRRLDARRGQRASVREGRRAAERHRVPAERHSHDDRRCVRDRATSCRCCCSSLLFGFALHAVGERARPVLRFRRSDLAGAVPHRRLHHAARADRRVRRDGVHDRQVRPGDARLARQADGLLLRDLSAVHLRRARRHRARARLQRSCASCATSAKSCSSCSARRPPSPCCRA